MTSNVLTTIAVCALSMVGALIVAPVFTKITGFEPYVVWFIFGGVYNHLMKKIEQ